MFSVSQFSSVQHMAVLRITAEPVLMRMMEPLDVEGDEARPGRARGWSVRGDVATMCQHQRLHRAHACAGCAGALL